MEWVNHTSLPPSSLDAGGQYQVPIDPLPLVTRQASLTHIHTMLHYCSDVLQSPEVVCCEQTKVNCCNCTKPKENLGIQGSLEIQNVHILLWVECSCMGTKSEVHVC